MKGLLEQTRALVLDARLAPVVLLAALLASEPVWGQGVRSPYGYDPYDDTPPRSAIGSEPYYHPPAWRGLVAKLLARRGYRLVGALREAGDEIIASGVDAGGRRMRFLIDAYEGEVLRSWPIDPPDAYGEPGPGRAYAPRDFTEGEYIRPPVPRPHEPPGAYESRKEATPRQRSARPAEKASPEQKRAEAARVEAPHSPPHKTQVPSQGPGAPALAAAPPPNNPTNVPAAPALNKPQPVNGPPASTQTPSAPSQPKAASTPAKGSDGLGDMNLARSQPKQPPLPGIENQAAPKANAAQ